MRRLLLVPALLGVAVPSLARADGASDADLRTFRASTDRHGTLATEGIASPGHLNLQVAHWFSFESASLRLDRSTATTTESIRVLGPRLLGEPTVNLGLGTRAAIGASLPYAIYQDGAASPLTDGRPAASQGIGDLALTGKAVVREADPDRLRPGFAFLARMQLPTGDRSSFISDRGTIAELRALAGLDLLHFLQVTATVGYRMRFVQHPITDVTIGDTIPWGLTLSVKPRVFGFDRAGKWKVNLEGHGEIGAVPNGLFKTSRVSPAFLGLSTRYELSQSFSMFAGVEASLTEALGAPALRGLFGLTYAPTIVDDDHDGVADEVDECPGLPEDGKGKAPRDGCPDYEGDETPVEPAPVPKMEEPPLPPPAIAPVASADSDADGIPDESDKCPDQPENKNGYEDDDGCPESDKDADTFLDAVDHCPDQAETFNGLTDEDGCPEEAVAKKPLPKPLVVEGKGTLALARSIKFDVNTPSKDSTSDLRAVAAWLLAHPDHRVRIAVRPDGKGEEAAKTSTTRAISIVEALIAFAHTGGIAEAVPWDPKLSPKDAPKTNVLVTIVAPPGAAPPEPAKAPPPSPKGAPAKPASPPAPKTAKPAPAKPAQPAPAKPGTPKKP